MAQPQHPQRSRSRRGGCCRRWTISATGSGGARPGTVIDLLFVYKEADGTVGSIELGDLGAELEPSFVDLDGQLGGGLLDAEDVEEVAAGIEPGNSVATIVVENLWVVPFVNPVRNAGGELVDQARIPADVVAAVPQGGQPGP